MSILELTARMFWSKMRFRKRLALLIAFTTVVLLTVFYLVFVDPSNANVLIFRSRAFGYDAIRYLEKSDILPESFFTHENDTEPLWKPGVLNESAMCPEQTPQMKGVFPVNMTVISSKDVITEFAGEMNGIDHGVLWSPSFCKPAWSVAVIIPFRNRHVHLPILLRHLVPMLQHQQVQFGIYVIEQASTSLFNRAALLNIGYLESVKDHPWDCFIFHDVDHVPENDRNYYGCSGMPRHFAKELDRYSYVLPYNNFFGGVSGLTAIQFQIINGFSNQYWGWGSEDDDLYNRVINNNMTVQRPPWRWGRYQSIPHHHNSAHSGLSRFAQIAKTVLSPKVDGLNTINYKRLSKSVGLIYTNITIDIHP